MTSPVDRYLLAEKAGTEGVWDWDLRAGTLYLSPRFRDFLGLPPSESPGPPDDWLERVHPEDLDWLHAALEGQRGGVTLPFHIEHRVRPRNAPGESGEWRWLVCRGMAVCDESQQPVRLVGSVADVTERKLAELQLRRSEERYALAAAASNDGLYDWDLATGRVYYAPRWKAMLGFDEHAVGDGPQEWLGRVHEEDLIWLTAALGGAEEDGKPFQIEYRMRDARDTQRWMSCRGIAVKDAAGAPVRIVGSQADVTDRKLAEQQLRLSEERYALAAQGANDGLWDWWLDRDEVYYSPRWKAMLGYADDRIGSASREWFSRVHKEDVDGLRAALDLHLAGERENLQHEFRMHAADGAVLWMLARGLAVRDDSGQPVRLAGSMTDITARKKAEQQLLFDAVHDGMTGLPNRTLLIDRTGLALDRHRRARGKHFALLLIDLDRFKAINDAKGPAIGDLILRTMSRRLEDSRRMGDTLARLSADEFALLLNDVDDVGDALTAARRLAAIVAEPVPLDDHAVVLTASIGVALSATGYDRPEDMLRDAGLAVYRAKQNGRNRVDVFDSTLRRQAMSQMRTEADLRTALERGQLCLFYQPIVSVLTGRIAGFEALMRWRHPKRGLVSPAEFIPLAEECGLIVPMGRWALQEATRQLAGWQARFPRPKPLFMSVNVSSQQFRDDDLLSLVEAALAEHRIPPSSLKLEITESLLMQDPEKCRELMRAIRDLDVRFSIDDFGTGYSSLAYLHKFPADTLKIDRTFVSAISKGESSAAIVQVITTLAAILNMDVVAEGVETETEAEFLRDIVCTYGQGYLWARPEPAEEAEARLVGESVELGAA
ncbi:EAL domain-containing protein [Azospirillum sp. TSO22-1]|uniref:sensor domain-containing protein n=1 Tax=Azospirillum sp. TSO22-1 TaxID=716789 RepID=UPI000D612594|nr:EAL domain-containing protein [Azospirillum sp. TSO22-1]PWC53148.1 diguanylate cyclase [Azospirillum sp. TSO22-1]